MRSRRHVEELGETGIDLAPMLDFVLNLLIFFIITTSFVREAGITVNRPEAMTAQHEDSGNILVAIAANGDIWMDRHKVDLREVRPLIERLHVERPDDTVVVVADKAARADLLGKVMDEVQLGGIREVAIAATGVSGTAGP
jgi:biopolymer transport protein ExbD